MTLRMLILNGRFFKCCTCIIVGIRFCEYLALFYCCLSFKFVFQFFRIVYTITIFATFSVGVSKDKAKGKMGKAVAKKGMKGEGKTIDDTGL
jgi:hypothetical protein